MKKLSVLWLEDQAMSMLTEYYARVVNTGKYSIDIALDASEATRKIQQKKSDEIYDIIIADIRIMCGDDKGWEKFFFSHGEDKISVRLGIEFLKLILNKNAEVKISGFKKPDWIIPQRIGILTVESRSEVEADLKELGIIAYRQKIGIAGTSLLLEIIEEIAEKI